VNFSKFVEPTDEEIADDYYTNDDLEEEFRSSLPNKTCFSVAFRGLDLAREAIRAVVMMAPWKPGSIQTRCKVRRAAAKFIYPRPPADAAQSTTCMNARVVSRSPRTRRRWAPHGGSIDFAAKRGIYNRN
jgi:hypothetical protein